MKDRIFLSPPHMGKAEKQFLIEAFDSNWCIGPRRSVEVHLRAGVPRCPGCGRGGRDPGPAVAIGRRLAGN